MQARLHILGQMNAVLETPRESYPENAPSMMTSEGRLRQDP